MGNFCENFKKVCEWVEVLVNFAEIFGIFFYKNFMRIAEIF